MASSKQYGYYIEGNKVAIVEKDVAFDNDPNSKDYGPGANTSQWKSPLADVSNGLEIQYSYAPIYNLQSTYTNDSDLFKFIGWGSDGTNLLLFTYSVTTQKDLSSKFAADDWIYINSGRWIGLHQVKSTGSSSGVLTLKTKCKLTPNKLSLQGTFDTVADTFAGENAAQQNLMQEFKDDSEGSSTKYIFITDAATTADNGFYEITHGAHGAINIVNKITINATNDYTSTAANTSSTGTDDVVIYNSFYEQMEVYKNVEVLQDESFEIDLPIYLQKALIYYIKAKMFEDLGDLKVREYFHAQFLKQVERHNNGRTSGLRIVAPGANSII